jgi:hypothetical protein
VEEERWHLKKGYTSTAKLLMVEISDQFSPEFAPQQL